MKKMIIDSEDFELERLDTLADDDDVVIKNIREENEESSEYSWANFDYKRLWEKTDRWDVQNYQPTEWEIFLRKG